MPLCMKNPKSKNRLHDAASCENTIFDHHNLLLFMFTLLKND